MPMGRMIFSVTWLMPKIRLKFSAKKSRYLKIPSVSKSTATPAANRAFALPVPEYFEIPLPSAHIKSEIANSIPKNRQSPSA